LREAALEFLNALVGRGDHVPQDLWWRVVMPGAATPPKWDHSLEPLFDELSKDLV
jgi:hypothetical protein